MLTITLDEEELDEEEFRSEVLISYNLTQGRFPKLFESSGCGLETAIRERMR